MNMPALHVGETQEAMPHIISYRDRDGQEKQGQVWSLAPVPQWDSSAYWVIPADANSSSDMAYVVKRSGRYRQDKFSVTVLLPEKGSTRAAGRLVFYLSATEQRR